MKNFHSRFQRTFLRIRADLPGCFSSIHSSISPIIILVSLLFFFVLSASYLQASKKAVTLQTYASLANDIESFTHANSDELYSGYSPLAHAYFQLQSENPFALTFTTSWILSLCLLIVILFCWLRDHFPLATLSSLALALLFSLLALGPTLVLTDFAFITALPLILCTLFLSRKNYLMAGWMLGLGLSMSLFSVILCPLIYFTIPRLQRLRAIGRCLVAVLLSLLAGVSAFGFPAFLSILKGMFAYDYFRGIHIESLWSSIDLVFRNVVHTKAVVAVTNIGTFNDDFSPLFVAISTAVVGMGSFVIVFHRRTKDTLFLTLIRILAWTLCFGSSGNPSIYVLVIPLLSTFLLLESKSFSRTMFAMLGTHLLLIALLTGFVSSSPLATLAEQSNFFLVLALFSRAVLSISFVCLLFFEHLARLFRFRWPLPLWADGLLALVALVLLLTANRSLVPDFRDTTLQFEGKEAEEASLPLNVETNGSPFRLSTTLVRTSPLQASVLRIRTDNCLHSIRINARNFLIPGGKICGQAGRIVDLAPLLEYGSNSIDFALTSLKGRATLSLSLTRRDPSVAFHRLLILLVLALLFLRLVLRSPSLFLKMGWSIFGFGTILRSFYMFATVYNVRSYDANAHLAYVRYVLDHWSIPAAGSAWEYHQAPLYYFVAAIWKNILSVLTYFPVQSQEEYQMLALVLSVATLAAGMWAAYQLYPKNTLSFSLFSLLLATAPALVFFSSRISNDVLYTFFAFLFVALLLRFLRTGRVRDWFSMSVVIALGFLSKANAALFFPIAAIASQWNFPPFIKKRLSGNLLLLSFGLIGMLTGWLVYLRLFIEEKTTKTLSFGHYGMNKHLIIPENQHFWNYVTFDPLQVLLHPFNNNWTFLSRREYFFEYFYRSAFFGEFQFPEVPSWLTYSLLVLGLPLITIVLLRVYAELRRPTVFTVSMILLLLTLTTANLLFRYKFGCACDQDFRFAVLLLVPLSYFIVNAVTAARGFIRYSGLTLLLLFAASSSTFLAQFYFL